MIHVIPCVVLLRLRSYAAGRIISAQFKILPCSFVWLRKPENRECGRIGRFLIHSDEEKFMLKGKIALVTGASSGIGRATAKVMAQEGARVAITGRQMDALEELVGHIAAAGGEAVSFAGDLRRDEDRRKIVSAAAASFGGLDILVNAAGTIANGTIENTALADWRAMFELNLEAVFSLMQLAVPYLEKNKGSIVNVSSVTGIRAFPNVLAYCVSKAGVDQLTRCAALELAPKGIRVNAVDPGVVVSNLHRRSGMTEEKYQAFLEHSRATHPLGRVGQPEDIANAIVFLASDRSAWITGASIPIDGGRHQTCAR
jgi:NAD(P)-dependent dehydrogenase (short-subunit alcohol dehydrogenase family)